MNVTHNPAKCEVCGGHSSVHVTDVYTGWRTKKREHHYCREHAPPDIRAKMGGPADEVKAIQQMIEKAEASNMSDPDKAEHIQSLQKLADDIAAGRRRFGDRE